MLFINWIQLTREPIRNPNSHTQNLGIFLAKKFPSNYSLESAYLCAKRISFLSTLVFAQLLFRASYREILEKYKKRKKYLTLLFIAKSYTQHLKYKL